MIKKIVQIFIFCAYWLCLVPSLVYFLWQQNILRPNAAMEYFTHYTVLLFVLILVYWLIHHIFDTCYLKHEIRKKVRKITIKRQLDRLEKGELSLEEAQNFKTFTRPKSPQGKRKHGEQPPNKHGSGKRSAPGTPTGSLTRNKGRLHAVAEMDTPQGSRQGTPRRERKLLKPHPPIAPPPYQESVNSDGECTLP
ncbi:uncharacterized protein LOC142223770 [Haematobia irritans]|uniref:uncharacterized protein LOC142223770 n=1 Tax=Haematobia irritans TaxID=7368 RepID=UPI003F50B239